MNRRFFIGLATGFFLLSMTNLASATLITIGTASYNGSDYNLIWDNDDDLVWLDYTNTKMGWRWQKAWAEGLNSAGVLTYAIDSAYTVDWGTNDWRLPTTVDGPAVRGYEGEPYTYTYGYNLANSEMGHLFYNELWNKGFYATDGTNPQPGYGLQNTGDFKNLFAYYYWSDTGSTYLGYTNPGYYSRAWGFNMDTGFQGYYDISLNHYGLAVRSGQVSTAPVPEPATMLLFGIGLLGLAGVNRRR